MAEFDVAVAKVLAHEGGFTPGLPDDPGGATNMGISQRAYPDVDIKSLTVDAAKAIYLKDYWKPYMEQEIDQRLANCALDCAVNQGPSVANRLYLMTNPSIKEFQIQRLLRYAVTGKSQFFKAWFSRTLDV